MGSAPPIGLGVAQHFQHLVLCAMEFQLPPELFPGVNVIYAPMNDDGKTPMSVEEMKIAVRTAKQVVDHLEHGDNVLVTCRQGRNRSGIVTALTLCMGPPQQTPQQAIARIRMARGYGAMRNRDFNSFLLRFYKYQRANSGI
jgi:protein-tyrosine phosphatase